MFDTQHSKRLEADRTQAMPAAQKPGNPKRTIQLTGDLTRIPLYAQAWGNQPPPWLRLPVSQQVAQAKESSPQEPPAPIQRQENATGLPDTLKAGVENLSGLAMDDVRVHYNSAEPAQVQALAYTQGTDIHVGPGQEKHLPHEAWHVVQQKQGRVQPTVQAKGVMINDDRGLEKEADVMGARATNYKMPVNPIDNRIHQQKALNIQLSKSVMQRRVGFELEMDWMVKAPGNTIGKGITIFNGPHWHAEPDMKPPTPEMRNERHYTGYGNLEFVTDAFAESAAGRGLLQLTLNEIVGLVRRIAGSWYGFSGWGNVKLADFVGGTIVWGAQTPGATRDDIWIDRLHSAGMASPQMTAGIRLERVSNVLAEMGQATPPGQPDLYGRAPSPVGAPLNPARANLAQIQNRAVHQAALSVHLAAPQRSEYEGAVAHLGTVVALGAQVNVGSNEKYLSPLLSRTNFGLLPVYIRNNPDLRRDVMIASGRGTMANWNVQMLQPLFSASPNMNQRTIDSWLTDISNGHDPLHWGQEGNLARWNPQVVGPVGHQSVGHVYEFRGVSGILPVGSWIAWALDLFDRVMNTLNH